MADIEKAETERHDGVEDVVAEAKKAAEVDTVHQDEAMKVLATYTGDLHWTDEEEKALLRRIDFRLMPILIATYGLQYYDKAMLAQAVSSTSSSRGIC
jgi:hypothetical protein